MQVNRNFIAAAISREAVNNTNQVSKPLDNEQFDFRHVMQNAVGNRELQFSKHANMRLDARNIQLNPEQIRRVEKGISAAQNKGVKDSLVLVDNIALLVNITNKVVVTALNHQDQNQNSDSDQVFTNIDGAVIV